MALTTAQQLADAQDKYHKLQTGQLARVFVDQNGERVEFTAANRQALYRYILSLQAIIAGDSTAARPKAFGMYF